mmetsp:Transcript_7330/g.10710  ORF Transcript_7330/g.10710 Transcript_7330/m.10710 type:complete len:391 (-) Transcript_7330:92-1264(-)
MVVSWVHPTLYNLTNELMWPEVISRARSHPEEISWKDNEEGKTVLHHAARHFYSLDVVREMLNCSDPAAAAIQDKRGQTPLHAACWNGSSEIIQILLFANPSVASIRDNRGRMPLHLACSSVSLPTAETIGILLKADSKAATTVDQAGKTPLVLLCERHESRLQTAAEFMKHVANNGGTDMMYASPRETVYGKILRPFWNQLRLLLDACVKPEFNNSHDQSLVHAVSSIPNCPSTLFDLAVSLYPEQVKEKVFGSLPLHCAAECPTITDDEDSYYVLQALLILFPHACRIPDSFDRLPLHLAIQSGKSYHGALKVLFEEFPDSISMRDGQHCLLPFMLAALSSATDSGTMPGGSHNFPCLSRSQTERAVNSALELLKLDPSGVKTSISSE